MPSRLAPRSRRVSASDAVSPASPAWFVGEVLHRGRFANVFRVSAQASRVNDDDHDFAMKIARCGGRDRAIALGLLRREVEVSQECRHAQLLTILDWQLQQAPFFHVSPYLEGRDLGKLIRGASPPLLQSLWIARQVAQALEHMHACGWMHGDVSADNVRVSSSGHVTLVDLAFARRLSNREDPRSTFLAGNRVYEPPEERAPGGPRAASDVYGLGRLIQSMLAMPEASQWRFLPAKETQDQVADWVARDLLAEEPDARPTMSDVVRQLVRWEIRTLGRPTAHVQRLSAEVNLFRDGLADL